MVLSAIHVLVVLLAFSASQAFRIKDENGYCLVASFASPCREDFEKQNSWYRVHAGGANSNKFSLCKDDISGRPLCLITRGVNSQSPNEQIIQITNKNVDDPKQQWSYDSTTKQLTNAFILIRCVPSGECVKAGPQCMSVIFGDKTPIKMYSPKLKDCNVADLGQKITFL